MSVDIFPGETFEMEVVAVGQLQGSVPSIVQAHVIGQTQGTLDHSQIVRTVERTCTRLTLTVRTSNNKIDIGINDTSRSIVATDTIAKHYNPMLYKQLVVSFYMKNCTQRL